jgi:uncharacterized protein (DUF697 family)
MAGLKSVFSIWENLKEVDLRPIRESALSPVKVAIIGRPGTGRHTLAEQMRRDPQRPAQKTQTAMLIADLDSVDRSMTAELIILMLDATAKDFSQEQAVAQKWFDAGKIVLACVNKVDLLGNQALVSSSVGWPVERVIHGSVLDPAFIQHEFVPVILELLPERHLALGRQFPLFRVAIAQQLINESSFANAVYSFSTGVAEIVAVLDIPLTVTDTIVLTKAQAFLVYKLGLTLGFSTRWQDYLAEFGSVIGGGFIFRQLSRMLIGLIPFWGILPKVAVAYSGTYVVGHVILQWYLNGRHVTKQQMNALYSQALLNGRRVAEGLVSRLPRPRLHRRKKEQLPVLTLKICTSCMKPNAQDAVFCQYCGQPFQPDHAVDDDGSDRTGEEKTV